MAKEKILIVEDDPDISEMITYNLEREGYKTVSVGNGEEAVARVAKDRPELIILDIMLPGMDGLEVCRTLKQRESTEEIPIIILSARSQETDKVVGLELGADDYITKPFSPRELVARIRAVLRRLKHKKPGQVVHAGEVELDSKKHKAYVSGKEITLTSTEFSLLEYFANRQGEALTREQILDSVFGYSTDVYDRTVDTHVKTLRKKLGTAREYIETVRGVGYRFKDS
jgi:phosphate regulon transcriptional regulator PhoB